MLLKFVIEKEDIADGGSEEVEICSSYVSNEVEA